MSILFDCKNLTKTWSSSPIFTEVSFAAFAGDHLGIIGPNGAGKSTLLKIIAGEVSSDAGEITRRRGLSMHYVPQMPSFPPHCRISELLARLDQGAAHETSAARIQAESLLMQAGLYDLEQEIGSLSGGWHKRVALALGFAAEAELLLLDEPTNHLDLAGILWLEKLLLKNRNAWIMVSHDRSLLSSTVKKIIEINKVFPGNSLLSEGNYERHLLHRSDLLAGLASQQESLQNKLRREKEWLRQGVKARTTKSKFRMDQAYELEETVSKLSNKARITNVDFSFSANEGKSRILMKLNEVSCQLGEQKIINKFSCTIQNKQILGILGSNGSGKSTMLNIFTGAIKPQEGTITFPPQIRSVYFTQDRRSLDPELTLKQAVAPDSDSVKYREQLIHFASWLRRFGFTSEHHHTKVGKLSGGEQARLLIAQLMLQPADLLLLDEPTNDLDIQTLEALEQSLREFEGAVVIVSHDRYLMERLCQSYLGFVENTRGEKTILPFASVQQWQNYSSGLISGKILPLASASTSGENPLGASIINGQKSTKKLSYLEQREYDGMEKTIATYETELKKAHEDLAAAASTGDSKLLQQKSAQLNQLQEKTDALYLRWEELEGKRSAETDK